MYSKWDVEKLAHDIIAELPERALESVRFYVMLEERNSYRPDYALLTVGLKASQKYGGLPWVMNAVEIARVETEIVRQVKELANIRQAR